MNDFDHECSGVKNENRNYIGVLIGGKHYDALYDPGTTTIIEGKAIAI